MGQAMKRVGHEARRISGAALALLLLVWAAPVDAQVPVEGEVLDGISGMPVGGAIVQFPDLGLATLTDSMGYFRFEAVPRGTQVLATYHMAYEQMAGEAPVVAGDVLVVKLTPKPIEVAGMDVDIRARGEVETDRQGRMSDFISPREVEEMASRTNKVLEVMRAKAPPRLQIKQAGGVGGMKFCITNTRQRPSVQELRDLGTGCKPALLVMDGVVVYAPPRDRRFAAMAAPTLPSDVAWMIVNQDPNEIESIRVLTGSDAFFRYGEDGRLGAVEIVTKRPGRNR